MQFRQWVSRGAVALTLAVSGCADAATGGGAISLSTAEVNQLFTEINAIIDQAGVNTRSADVRLFLSRVPAIGFNRAVTIADNINCAGNGTAAFSGSQTPDGSSVDVTITFSGCVTTHYTVGGNYHIVVSTTSTAITATGTGNLDVTATGGRSGSCNIDYKVTFTQGGQSISGKICGVDASTISAVA